MKAGEDGNEIYRLDLLKTLSWIYRNTFQKSKVWKIYIIFEFDVDV